jgi:hypothetical protein
MDREYPISRPNTAICNLGVDSGKCGWQPEAKLFFHSGDGLGRNSVRCSNFLLPVFGARQAPQKFTNHADNFHVHGSGKSLKTTFIGTGYGCQVVTWEMRGIEQRINLQNLNSNQHQKTHPNRFA